MPETPSQRLLARLRAMGVPIPEGAVIRRTHAGLQQRRNGAWSWFVDPDPRIPGTTPGLGSQVPVTELLRTDRLVVSGSYDPCSTSPYVDPWTPAGTWARNLFEEPERTR